MLSGDGHPCAVKPPNTRRHPFPMPCTVLQCKGFPTDLRPPSIGAAPRRKTESLGFGISLQVRFAKMRLSLWNSSQLLRTPGGLLAVGSPGGVAPPKPLGCAPGGCR